MHSAAIDKLNGVCKGWSEVCPGGLLCNPNPGGGIIDQGIVDKKWFVVFEDGSLADNLDSRDEAVKAFVSASKDSTSTL